MNSGHWSSQMQGPRADPQALWKWRLREVKCLAQVHTGSEAEHWSPDGWLPVQALSSAGRGLPWTDGALMYAVHLDPASGPQEQPAHHPTEVWSFGDAAALYHFLSFHPSDTSPLLSWLFRMESVLLGSPFPHPFQLLYHYIIPA